MTSAEDGGRSPSDVASEQSIGRDLVRSARAASSSRYRTRATGRAGRIGRALAKLFGEVLGELILGLLAFAILGAVVAATWFGWQHSRLATVGVYVAAVAFLGYGGWTLWTAARHPVRPARRPRLAAAAVTTVLIVGFWLSYIVIYWH